MAATVLQGRGPDAPRGCPPAEDEEELQLDAGEEPCPQRQLCGALAAAVVSHSPPPTDVTPPTGVSAFSLALAGDEPRSLLHLPVMEHGRLITSPLEPAGSLPADSAAWAAYEAAAAGGTSSGGGGRQAAPPLVWRGGSGSELPAFPDWRALLESESGEDSPPPAALVTVPIVAPGGVAPLGAATFALEEAPTQEQVEELAALGACLACSIAHQTKNLWEESLGFLNSVIPRRVAQRMLSAALTLGPLAAVAAPPPQVAAAAAAAVVAEAAAADLPATAPSTPASGGGGAKLRWTAPSTPLSPSGRWSGGWTPRSPLAPAEPAELYAMPADLAHPASPLAPCTAARSGAAGPSAMVSAEPSPERLAFGAEPAVAAEIKTLRQKWNLEFADPLLEESYKLWFNTMQTQTDLQAFRYFSVLLLLLFAALLLRGGMTLGDFLAVAHGVLSVATLGVLMLLKTPWYVAHRSLVVASVRISSAALLLLHVYLDPCFYSGSLLKGLAGSCALTLLIAPLRNRLRFSNHLLVQLAKLNLCGLTNSFMYADPQRAQRAHLPLLTTTLIQLGAALLPSLLVYRLEASQRRKFIQARLSSLSAAAAGPSSSRGSSGSIRGKRLS